ncbi:hypothetical protein MNBD_GAMMA07-2476 [hydrothermal vent metagenome]|uniref:YhdP central domain-containing protein n=1 Tax=hydrothermal vent metagenome TaxID=652676 RepID=A0A3B0X162_9ZZZZ
MSSSPIINNKKKITLKRLKNWSLSFLGLLLIILAISFTLVRVAIKSIPDYSIAIQKFVSKELDVTIDIGKMDAEIFWLVPRLNLIDVNVSDKTGEHYLMYLEEIDITLDWSETIKKLSPIIEEVTLVGLNIKVGINEKSQLLIQHYVVKENINTTLNAAIDDVLTDAANNDKKLDFYISQAIKDNFKYLNFKIINSQILFYDDRYDKRNQLLTDFDLRLKNSETSHVFEVNADLPKKYGKKTRIIIEVTGDLFDYKNLKGKTYFSLDDINISPWMEDYWRDFDVSVKAKINGEVWLEWQKTRIVNVSGRANVFGLSVNYSDDNEHEWKVDELSAGMRWQGDKHDWQLDVRDLIVNRKGDKWSRPAALMLKVNDENQQVELQADFLRLEGLLYLGGMVNHVTELKLPVFDFLDEFKPSGMLKNINIHLPLLDPHNVKINTEFDQIGLTLLGEEKTEITNLQGSVRYLNDKTWLTLNSKDVNFTFSTLFRSPIFVNQIKGELELSHLNHEWNILSDALSINTPNFESNMRVALNVPDEGRIFLDLTAHAKNIHALSVSRYMPTVIMDDDVIEWLDMAFSESKKINGQYQFYGFLNDMPFRKNEGISLADVSVTGLNVNYLKDWPNVNNITADIRFKNDSMLGVLHKAEVLDSDILNASVFIDNFDSPMLYIEGQVDAQLKDLKRYANESELHEYITDYIDNLDLKGKGMLSLKISLPLYGDITTQVEGRIDVKNGGLKFKKEKYEFNKINGTIHFSDVFFESSNLTAELLGNQPGDVLNVDIRTQKNQQDTPSYFVSANGNILATSLLLPVPVVQSYFKGSSHWLFDFKIINSENPDASIITGKLASDMQGVEVSLLGPLHKLAEELMPIEIKIDVKSKNMIGYQLDAENGDKVILNHKNNELLFALNTKGIRGDIKMDLSSEFDTPIKLDLAYLNLNTILNLTDKNDLKKQSVDKNKVKKNMLTKVSEFVSPLDFPSIDFFAETMILKKTVYTDSTLKTHKSKLGTVIDSFKLANAKHTITGKGNWFSNKKNHSTTKLNVNIDVNDLGSMLKNLDINDGLLDTTGNIKLRWRWGDAPHKFDWKLVQGDAVLTLRNGTLKDLNAGAGRLLGLLSFKTLLSLDFGDQLKDGFKFDKAQGRFVFYDENITTRDFSIESKMADMRMEGYFSIANDTVDQIVTVKPSVGETFSIGAAVIAGPAAGGIVYLLQKIFDTDRLSEYQYSMKGNLDDPVVDLISVPVPEEDEEDEDF